MVVILSAWCRRAKMHRADNAADAESFAEGFNRLYQRRKGAWAVVMSENKAPEMFRPTITDPPLASNRDD